MKTVKIILWIMLFAIAGVMIRQLWYYPLFRRPPLLEISSNNPITLSEFQLSSTGTSKIRYYLLIDDKDHAFPESNKVTWSAWGDKHDIVIGDESKWIKIFIEEKWAFYRKRSWMMFFNVGLKQPLFNKLMASRYDVSKHQIKNRKRIVYIGDSLTDGLFASDKTLGFVPQVEKTVGINEKPATVNAIGIKTVNFSIDQIKQNISPKTEVIVVELGTNDYNSTDLSKFHESYRTLLNTLKIINPNVKLICLSTWDGYRAYLYDEIIMDEVIKRKGTFVYLGDLFENNMNKSTKGNITPWGPADDFHPSDQGHKAIAERVINAITSME